LEKEIRSRLAKGQHIITPLRNIWKVMTFEWQKKIRFLKTLVWTVATNRCEENKINAFEIKKFEASLHGIMNRSENE